MKQPVCVLGAGRMGSSLATALVNNGHPTWVWNRTPEKCAPLVAMGAKSGTNLQDVVRAAEIIFVIVLDFAASNALLKRDGVAPLLKGKTVVQLTSGSPRLAREDASWIGAQGAEYLDGAIMATPDFIGRPEAAILYSGSRTAYETCEPVLRILGGQTTYVGNVPGQASALDTALLAQMWGSLFGALQGMAVAQAEGIEVETLRAQLLAFKPVVDAALLDAIDRSASCRFAGDDGTLASLGAHYSAFRHLLEVCDERGLEPAFVRAMDRVFREALAQNGASADFASLAPWFQRDGTIAEVAEQADG